MKRLLMILVLMVAVATMMAPVSASAAVFNDPNGRADWEAAVGYIYTDVPSLPDGPVGGWTAYPLVPGNTFNFGGASLTASGGFYLFSNIPTLHMGIDPIDPTASPPNAFGFEIDPVANGTFYITAYLGIGASQGEITNSWVAESSPFFYGWTNLPVSRFDIVSFDTAFGIGNLVVGGVGDSHAPIPEPGMMMLVGSGLAGLAGWGRRRFKK